MSAFVLQVKPKSSLRGMGLPQWQGARAVEYRCLCDDLLAQCQEQRQRVAGIREALAREGVSGVDGLSVMIDRVEQLVPWLATRRLWEGRVRFVITSIRERPGDRLLRELMACTTSPPEDWERISERIDCAREHMEGENDGILHARPLRSMS